MLRRSRTALGLAVAALFALSPATQAASIDGVVEWSGASHLPTMDRRPLCPINGEAFHVRFQTWHYDLTSASVHVIAGATTTDVPATWIGQRGPYDVWSAQVSKRFATLGAYGVNVYVQVDNIFDESDIFIRNPDGTPVQGEFQVWLAPRTYQFGVALDMDWTR